MNTISYCIISYQMIVRIYLYQSLLCFTVRAHFIFHVNKRKKETIYNKKREKISQTFTTFVARSVNYCVREAKFSRPFKLKISYHPFGCGRNYTLEMSFGSTQHAVKKPDISLLP